MIVCTFILRALKTILERLFYLIIFIKFYVKVTDIIFSIITKIVMHLQLNWYTSTAIHMYLARRYFVKDDGHLAYLFFILCIEKIQFIKFYDWKMVALAAV